MTIKELIEVLKDKEGDRDFIIKGQSEIIWEIDKFKDDEENKKVIMIIK